MKANENNLSVNPERKGQTQNPVFGKRHPVPPIPILSTEELAVYRERVKRRKGFDKLSDEEREEWKAVAKVYFGNLRYRAWLEYLQSEFGFPEEEAKEMSEDSLYSFEKLFR